MWRIYVMTRRYHYIIAVAPSGKSQKYPFDYETFGWISKWDNRARSS